MIEELVGRWRGEGVRIGERTGVGLAAPFRELGLVTRVELEELELRVAQIEHRLRLLEAAKPLRRLGSVEAGRWFGAGSRREWR